MAGSLATDKRYPGIGRISRRTGTTDRKVLRRIHAAMDEAYSMGRSDLLKRIRDRDLSVQEFYTASKQGKLKSLRSANDIKPLKPTEGESPLLVWATGHSAQEYASYIKMFLTFATVDHSIGDLPLVLQKMRKAYADKAQMFKRTRAVVRSFVSHTQPDSRYSELYAAISAVQPLPITPKRKPRALSVAEVVEMLNKMLPKHQQMAWTCCLTGMRMVSEYLADRWEIQADRIKVNGTKTKTSVRDIPVPSVPPANRFYQRCRALPRFHLLYTVPPSGQAGERERPEGLCQAR